MKLSLSEAATRLGKTERQVRYLIQQGKLRAKKSGGRWIVELAEIDQAASSAPRERKEKALEQAVQDAVAKEPNPRRSYSLRSLKAFQVALPIHRDTCDLLGRDHPASEALHETLRLLAAGCHRFHRAEKAEAYSEGRDVASRALTELLISESSNESATTLADRIEQDLMPAFSGLLRRLDRKRHGPS